MEANCLITKKQTKDNLKNGEEYVGLIKTPYWNPMLDRSVLRIKERPKGHKSFLPQEMVQCEVWIGGFQKRHNYRWQSPHRKM